MANIRPLFPILDAKPISPLAHTAAESPLDSTGCLTEYRPLPTKSILSRVVSKRKLPFTYAINPYRGCEFACRYAHEFLELTPEDFDHQIYFKQNARWLLAQELKRLKPGTDIALGTATDPYQPLERRQRVTRSILKAFADCDGFELGIVTKSTLIARDIDLLQEIARRHKLNVHVAVTTVDPKLARNLEPRAPRPDLRIATVARLRQAGIRAGVMCSPLMPGITDSRGSIGAVAKAAAAAEASFFVAGALFLKACSLPTFLSFVGQHFPEQLKAYKRRYASSAFVSAEYRNRLQELVETIRHESKPGYRHEDAFKDSAATIRCERIELQPWLPFTQS